MKKSIVRCLQFRSNVRSINRDVGNLLYFWPHFHLKSPPAWKWKILLFSRTKNCTLYFRRIAMYEIMSALFRNRIHNQFSILFTDGVWRGSKLKCYTISLFIVEREYAKHTISPKRYLAQFAQYLSFSKQEKCTVSPLKLHISHSTQLAKIKYEDEFVWNSHFRQCSKFSCFF